MENRQSVLLSIIIPAYNVELYIRECLDSIFNELWSDNEYLVEVIVVNDGSIDNTEEILNTYSIKNNFTLINNQESSGVSCARNSGIRVANGKFLMFIDSDDYLVSGSLGNLLAFLANNDDADIVEYDFYEFISANKRIIDRRENPPIIRASGQDFYASWANKSVFRHLVWTKIVSKDLVMENKLFFYENTMHEDEEWTPKIFAYAKTVIYLPLHVYVYRIREGSLTSTTTRKSYFDRIKVFDSLVRFSSTAGFTEEYVHALRLSASSIFWSLFQGVNLGEKYDEALIHEIMIREYIIKYSSTFHRRIIYGFFVKLFGIKSFCFLKYSIKSYFHK
ncbi:glycosyltransferase family 2 protein [Cloacibacillus porcorum]